MKFIYSFFFVFFALALTACSKSKSNPAVDNPPVGNLDTITVNDNAMLAALLDNNLNTTLSADGKVVKFVLDFKNIQRIAAYSLYTSSDDKTYDPESWQVWGSTDNITWVIIDKRTSENMSGRLYANNYILAASADFRYLKFAVKPKGGKTVKIAEIKIIQNSPFDGWENWGRTIISPVISFTDNAPSSLGSKNFNQLVQNPATYLSDICYKVVKTLYKDQVDFSGLRGTVGKINFILTDQANAPGLAWKTDINNVPTVYFSTEYLAKFNLYDLSFEVQGVLVHELTHVYQLSPKGLNYGDADKVCFSEIEGLADAVRINNGFYDYKWRTKGGSWLDGYSRTGFFVQWLTNKDPNIIKKINASCVNSTDTKWTWDGAVKYALGNTQSVQSLWAEYQSTL